MTKNTGKDAERAFTLRIKTDPLTVIERFWDQSDLRGLNGGRAVGDFPKPSDFIVTQHNKIFYAEVKSVQGSVSFPFSNIKRGQSSAALRQAAVDGDYRFYIFSYGLGQWFVMPCDVYAWALEQGQSSIKFKELPQW